MLSAVKRWVVRASRSRLFARLLWQLERADRRQPNLLRTLMYHRVDHPDAHPELDPALLSATPAGFDRQMQFLAEHYRVVSLQAVLEAFQGGRPLPPRAVLLTFDDAYQDFATHAWPILKRMNVPVTLFVPTAYPDHPERTLWWDRLYRAFLATPRRDALSTPLGPLPLHSQAGRYRAYRRVKVRIKAMDHDEAMAWAEQLDAALGVPALPNAVLGWDALRQLAREGVTLAAHTQTHPLVNRLPPALAAVEIGGSFCDLQREIGSALPVFAYPAGGVQDAVVGQLPRLEVSLAFTTLFGVDRVATADPLRLRRINVGRDTTLELFRARLLPWWHRSTRRPTGGDQPGDRFWLRSNLRCSRRHPTERPQAGP